MLAAHSNISSNRAQTDPISKEENPFIIIIIMKCTVLYIQAILEIRYIRLHTASVAPEKVKLLDRTRAVRGYDYSLLGRFPLLGGMD